MDQTPTRERLRGNCGGECVAARYPLFQVGRAAMRPSSGHGASSSDRDDGYSNQDACRIFRNQLTGTGFNQAMRMADLNAGFGMAEL
jgi:hypothetical protein